jgi:hypothetical protein
MKKKNANMARKNSMNSVDETSPTLNKSTVGSWGDYCVWCSLPCSGGSLWPFRNVYFWNCLICHSLFCFFLFIMKQTQQPLCIGILSIQNGIRKMKIQKGNFCAQNAFDSLQSVFMIKNFHFKPAVRANNNLRVYLMIRK